MGKNLLLMKLVYNKFNLFIFFDNFLVIFVGSLYNGGWVVFIFYFNRFKVVFIGMGLVLVNRVLDKLNSCRWIFVVYCILFFLNVVIIFCSCFFIRWLVILIILLLLIVINGRVRELFLE